MLEQVCQYCGKVFTVSAYDTARGRGKFCSSVCYGKHRIGTHLSTEAKRKVSIANRSKSRPQELRDRVSATLKAKYANGYTHPMLGKKHSEESRAKISEGNKGKHQRSDQTKQIVSEFMKNKWQSPDYREKVSKILMENHKTFSGRIRTLWLNPNYRREQIKRLKQYYNNAEVKRQVSERAKANWRNPDYVSSVMKARGIKPSKPEKQLIDILSRYFPDFEYNGDSSLGVTLGGLTPDFVNVNGKKDLIELFGDYYHSPEIIGNDWRRSELGKVMVYNSLGWKCLVIWEHELKELTEEQIVDKVRLFFRGKAHSKLSLDKSKKEGGDAIK